jgi:hypothetical protein
MKFSEDVMFNYKWNVAKVATHCAHPVLFIITQKIEHKTILPFDFYGVEYGHLVCRRNVKYNV